MHDPLSIQNRGKRDFFNEKIKNNKTKSKGKLYIKSKKQWKIIKKIKILNNNFFLKKIQQKHKEKVNLLKINKNKK